MSIKIMSKVWEQSSHEGSPLLLLLALADHASDDGVCWPGIPRLAYKTRKTERHTKRLLIKLEKSGEVYIAREVGRGNTNMYYITLGFDEEDIVHTLIKRFEFDPAKAVQVAQQIIQLQEKGDTQDTFSDEEQDEKGDTQGQEKVTSGAEKVTPGVQKDDIAVSPESSLTVIEPSEENRQKEADSFPKNPEQPQPDRKERDDENPSIDDPHGRDSRSLDLGAGGSQPAEAAGISSTLPDRRGDDAGAGMADPVVESVVTQTETHLDEFDLARATLAHREAAGGAWTDPPPAGGDDAVAARALACFCNIQGEMLTDDEQGSMVLKFSEILKPLKTSVEEVDIAFEIMAEDFKYRVGNYNPFQDSFKNDLATCIRRARGRPQAKDTRRDRDVEAMEVSLAALEERRAARPPPVEGDLAWENAKREIALQMTRPTFDTWVRDTYGLGQEDGVYTVLAPDALTRDWLESRLKTTAQRTLVGILSQAVEVRFEVGEPLPVAPEEVA